MNLENREEVIETYEQKVTEARNVSRVICELNATTKKFIEEHETLMDQIKCMEIILSQS